jgi:hypothetical protein
MAMLARRTTSLPTDRAKPPHSAGAAGALGLAVLLFGLVVAGLLFVPLMIGQG